MASCNFCQVEPEDHQQLKRCVCKKASYCSKECQAKDWKNHKPSCPPYTIREVPGKGRGLFATRKIKEGQIILDEYPLLTSSGKMSFYAFMVTLYPKIDESTKAKILEIRDPGEDLKMLDTETVKKLISQKPFLMLYREDESDEKSKLYRIICFNCHTICAEPDLYSKPTEIGLYNYISLINHACVGNATTSWVMGDFKRKQVRAIRTIGKDEEILVSYLNTAAAGELRVPVFMFRLLYGGRRGGSGGEGGYQGGDQGEGSRA